MATDRNRPETAIDIGLENPPAVRPWEFKSLLTSIPSSWGDAIFTRVVESGKLGMVVGPIAARARCPHDRAEVYTEVGALR